MGILIHENGVRGGFFAIVGLLTIAGTASAGEFATSEWAGVWEGTLGGMPIVACFVDSHDSQGEGAYYYRRHLEPIDLVAGDELGWREGDNKSRWELEAPSGDDSRGRWVPKGASKPLPIMLKRVAPGLGACASDRFNAPLESAQRLEAGKLERFGTADSFRRLRFLGEETIEIAGEGTVVARINRELRKVLPLSPEARRERLDYRRSEMGGLNSPSFGGDSATEPQFWSLDFLQVSFWHETTGRGRAGISIEYRYWDLSSGKEVDPWSWISVARDEQFALPASLRRFEQSPDTEGGHDCAEYRGKGDWDLTLEAAGLRFAEEAWGEGYCERDFLIPYAELNPMLTPAGKAAVARLRAHAGVERRY